MQDREPESWSQLLLKKWLSFKETGDEFDQDTDSNVEELSELEDFDDSDGSEGTSDFEARGLTQSGLGTDATVNATVNADLHHNSPLLRVHSETLHEQFVVNNQYKIAVGTWNVGGLLPPDDINLDGFLDSSDTADIYVLGFQEIVPLNANNVLCVEDDAPSVVWDGLIRHALNTRVKCGEGSQRSNSAPPSPMRHEKDVITDVPGVSDVKGLMNTVVNDETLESSLLQKLPDSSHRQWLSERTRANNTDQTVKGSTKNVKTAEDWLCEAIMPDDDVTDETPLMNSSHILSQHSCNQYSRVASKQMVGIFITVWVRSDLRRYVNNVKVCVVGCGILNFLRNKGAVSVSMSLHQTSFCFVCTHLTSGHKEGDELRRNTDISEILRRTTFPRLVKLSGMQLPETIMAHDRIVWLGDLNFRIDLPDDQTWILVNQCDWKSLLPKDQLKLERDAGRIFQGWHEHAIHFQPTYKFFEESDQYFGEHTFKGDKRRTPAWCDRILSYGKGLSQLSYSMVEARLSDHRPVIARFIADVEAVSRRKLSKACSLTNDEKVNAEELLPRAFPVSKFHSLHNHEHIEHSIKHCCKTCGISNDVF